MASHCFQLGIKISCSTVAICYLSIKKSTDVNYIGVHSIGNDKKKVIGTLYYIRGSFANCTRAVIIPTLSGWGNMYNKGTHMSIYPYIYIYILNILTVCTLINDSRGCTIFVLFAKLKL